MEKFIAGIVLAFVVSPLAAMAYYWQAEVPKPPYPPAPLETPEPELPLPSKPVNVPVFASIHNGIAVVEWQQIGDYACILRETTVIGCSTGELRQSTGVDINQRLYVGDVLTLYAYRVDSEETTLVGIGSAVVRVQETVFLPVIVQP